jgi:ABC-type Fe3+ transport system permease subunit
MPITTRTCCISTKTQQNAEKNKIKEYHQLSRVWGFFCLLWVLFCFVLFCFFVLFPQLFDSAANERVPDGTWSMTKLAVPGELWHYTCCSASWKSTFTAAGV